SVRHARRATEHGAATFARRGGVWRRGFHPAAPVRSLSGLGRSGRRNRHQRSASRRNVAGTSRPRRHVRGQRSFRHHHHQRYQERAVRRRRDLSGAAHRARTGLAANHDLAQPGAIAGAIPGERLGRDAHANGRGGGGRRDPERHFRHQSLSAKLDLRPLWACHGANGRVPRSKSMHDTVIRGGTIVDGSGKPGFTGDVALEGGKMAQVGGKIGAGKREIDANGLLVTPGWVDVHTHYDGQAMWDQELAPSSWHGVSTVLFGNCGVGFAPVRKTDHSALIGLMESIEEIPGIALADGLKWNWETFPEYLDALEQRPRAIDI